MKIIHDQIDRKNKRENKNNSEVPVIGKIGLEECGHPFFKQYGNTEQCRNQTQGKTFIRKMKEILEGEIKKEMERGTKYCGSHSIEG